MIWGTTFPQTNDISICQLIIFPGDSDIFMICRFADTLVVSFVFVCSCVSFYHGIMFVPWADGTYPVDDFSVKAWTQWLEHSYALDDSITASVAVTEALAAIRQTNVSNLTVFTGNATQSNATGVVGNETNNRR